MAKASKISSAKALKTDGRVELSKAGAQSVIAAAQCLLVLVEGLEYRRKLEGLVKTALADQAMRHSDVAEMRKLIEQFGDQMSQDVKDEYFRTMLQVLKSGPKVVPDAPK